MPGPRDNKWPPLAEPDDENGARPGEKPAGSSPRGGAHAPRVAPPSAGVPSRHPPAGAARDVGQRPTPVVGPPRPPVVAPPGVAPRLGTIGPEPEFTFGGEFEMPGMPALEAPLAARPDESQGASDGLNWDDLDDFPSAPMPAIPGPPVMPSGTGAVAGAAETLEFGIIPDLPEIVPNAVAPLALDVGDALSLVDRASLLPPAIVPDPRRELHDRYALGDFSGALVIADALLAENPDDIEIERVAAECRARLRQMYAARIGDFGHVPVMVVPRTELKWLSLDHRAGFLLSLVDGASSIEEIVDVSGMPVLEVLRTLYNLLTQRIIEVRPRGSRR